MNPSQDYKQLLSEVIKKQIVILGPDITLAKARNVSGLVVADDGTVTDISGDQQQITQKLVDQFVQLSGEIVKKTMEPLLSMNQGATPIPVQTPQPISAPTTMPSPMTGISPPTPLPQQEPVTQEVVAQDGKGVQ